MTLEELLRDARRITGGDINDAYDARLPDGRRAFVKTRAGVPPGEYAAEAAGLRWLGEGGARVPQVLEAGDDFLALEWIEAGRLDAAGEEALGRELATTHEAGAERFGSEHGLRLATVVLEDGPADEWPTFYAESRLLPLVERVGGAPAVERVCERIHDLAGPPEPPARLHGDLWSGNVLAAADGRPYLIDPAAYGGHREVDLAMLRLFGSPGAGGHGRTMAAYEEVRPLADGHEGRVALWQLFPLLVHAALFGGGYLASAERAAKRYL